MAKAKILTLKKPKTFNRRSVDRITNYNGDRGDELHFDLQSFGIKPEEFSRANIGFGDCAAAIRQGAARDEAFLYQFRSGELFFNENGSQPGLGRGGLLCIFTDTPNLGAIHFDF